MFYFSIFIIFISSISIWIFTAIIMGKIKGRYKSIKTEQDMRFQLKPEEKKPDEVYGDIDDVWAKFDEKYK